jgi:hypothetical protein
MRRVLLLIALLLFVPFTALSQTPVEEKVAVLITDWGMPAGYDFEHAWFDKNLLIDGVSIVKLKLCVKPKAKRRIENLGSLF